MMLVLTAMSLFVAAYWLYEVFDQGELVLDNAPGVASIVREKDTMIMTIRGDSEESIAYA